MRRPIVLLGAVGGAALALLSACDPCAGVASCATAPRVSVEGRIVNASDGRAVPNAQISLVRATGGGHDSVATTTDANGNYQASLSGDAGQFDVVVSPAGLPPYRVRGLSLASTTAHGDGHVLGVWVATPVLNVASELFYRATPNVLVQGAYVLFHRTGGVEISPSADYGSTTNEVGRVNLLAGAIALGADDVIGTLSVNLPGPLGTSVIPNFHISPDYEFHPQTVHRIGIGPQLSWIAAIYNRATVARVPGTTVTFRRTGGIPTSPESFTTVTNQSGEFVFPLVPLAQGTLIGDLTIQPPAPFHSYVRTGLQIPTFDADHNGFLADFGVGPHLPWDGTVECNGKPLQGATVFVVRVGGIAADPASFYATSDADGHFNMSVLKPRDYGTLIVDLEFTPPAGSGCIGLVQHNVQLPTLDFDSDIRFISLWALPRS